MARILIVDDESAIGRLLGSTLDLESLSGALAQNETALELLRTVPVVDMASRSVAAQTRLFIAEEQPFLRDSYVSLLRHQHEVQIVGVAGSASWETLATAIADTSPQVLLVGTKLLQPVALEHLKAVREVYPEVGVVLLSAGYDISGIRALREFSRGSSAGCAYLLKHTLDTIEQLVQVVQAVAQGRIILNPVVLDGLMSGDEPGRRWLHQLSPRELEVLSWIAKGVRNVTIAEELRLEPKTVERHINSIYGKLGNCSEPRHPRVHAVILYLKACGYLGAADFCDCP